MVAVGLPSGLRWFNAGNAGPFTLEGTRCHLVGRKRIAVVDPGPAVSEHIDAVAEAVEDADEIVILLTHGHADHSGAAPALAERLGAPVMGAWGPEAGERGASPGPPSSVGFRALVPGQSIPTDAGDLVAIETPGHARAHLAFHWPQEAAVFVGDLVLGSGDTTWVGAYPGCVRDYLASLARVEALRPRMLLPAHRPPIDDPADRLERYRAHRLARIAQVERALDARPEATPDELLHTVYGEEVPADLLPAARASLEALVEHVSPSYPRVGRGG